MSTRWCSCCAAEVQDTGGFCLLGHPLTVPSVTGSFSELRTQLDGAVDGARRDIAQAVGAAHSDFLPAPPFEPHAAAEEDARPTPSSGVGPQIAAPPPPPPPVAPPAPPAEPAPPASPVPAPPEWEAVSVEEMTRRLWARFEAEPEREDDPIVSFSPPPRMDWGPHRTTRRQLLRRAMRTPS